MLSINLKPIFAARGIEKPFSFLVKSGFTRIAAHHLINGTAMSFHLRNIDRLCTVLCCTPNDILAWQPNQGQPAISAQHPLHQLRAAPIPEGIQQLVSEMPLSDLRKLIAQLNQSKNSNDISDN